jgi:6-phosphogluconolactonase
MSVQRHVYPDPAAAAEACAHRITAILDETLSGKDYATLAVSGGSTPRLLFDQLAKAPVEWKRVHLFWVDERCVPPTSEESNFRLAEEHLIKPAHVGTRQVHRICGELRPDAAAKR